MYDFAPNALVGSGADLQRFAERTQLGTLELTCLDHAIYVLTQIGDKPLTEDLRGTLWSQFYVPVYELYTDGSGSILAYECEAHNGWHIAPGAQFTVEGRDLLYKPSGKAAVRTGLTRAIDTHECECGRPGARLTPALVLSQERPFLAAIA